MRSPSGTRCRRSATTSPSPACCCSSTCCGTRRGSASRHRRTLRHEQVAFVDDSKGYIATTGGARVEDYVALLKPRVMSLVVFTAIIGLLLAPGGINPVVGFIAILCIAIGAGGSGALNM